MASDRKGPKEVSPPRSAPPIVAGAFPPRLLRLLPSPNGRIFFGLRSRAPGTLRAEGDFTIEINYLGEGPRGLLYLQSSEQNQKERAPPGVAPQVLDVFGPSSEFSEIDLAALSLETRTRPFRRREALAVHLFPSRVSLRPLLRWSAGVRQSKMRSGAPTWLPWSGLPLPS